MKIKNSEGKSHKSKNASKDKKQLRNSTFVNGTNGKNNVNKSYFQLYLQRETPEQRARRLQNRKEEKKRRRSAETEEQRLDRLREEAEYMKKRRYNETPEQRKKRLLQRKKHYRETRGKKKKVSPDPPETENIKSASIRKTKSKLPSIDISMRNSKRQNVYNKENHSTVGMSTRANKRCSLPNNFLLSIETATEKTIHFGENSDRQSVDINEDQSVIEPKDVSSSPNGSSVLKESTTENTITSGIYSETNFGLASTILLHAMCRKHHSEYYHQSNHKFALICTTPRYNYSNIWDIIYWHKYTKYLNKMSLNSRQ